MPNNDEHVAVTVINLGFLGEPAVPTSEAQVAKWVVEMLRQIRRPPPLAPGFTEQAAIDGALLAASTLVEEHVRRRLPHKSADKSNADTTALLKRLNNLVADYIAEQISFQGN